MQRDQKSPAALPAIAPAAAQAATPLTSAGRAIGSVKAVRSVQLQMPADAIKARPRVAEVTTTEMALVGCSNMTTDTWNGEAVLLDVSSGAVLHRISAYGGVSAVDFAGPDHSLLLTAGDDGSVNVWGLDDALMALKQKEASATAAAAPKPPAPTGATGATGAVAKPKAAAAAAGDKDKAKPEAKAGGAKAGGGGAANATPTAMTDDGGDDDDDDDGGGLSELSAVSHVTSLYDHDDVVSALAVCPSAPSDVLTASWDRSCKLWDLTQPQHPVTTFDRHNNEVWAVRWAPADANVFVSSSRDKAVRFWDRRTASTTAGALGGAATSSAVTAMAYDAVSPHLLVTGSESGLMAVYDTRAAHKELLSYAVSDHYVRSVEACPGATGRFAVTTDSPLLPVVVLQYSANAAGQPSFVPTLSYRAHNDYPRGVCWTSDGALLTASWDRTVALVAPSFAA